MNQVQQTAALLRQAKFAVAFTGAGISVESGIAPFTGAGGLWNQYDPKFIEINFFLSDPARSWQEMKKIFFTDMDHAKPNAAHRTLAALEKRGLLQGIITQNIDGLHQRAGSKNVQEFHGTIHTLSCLGCGRTYRLEDVNVDDIPPTCVCGGILKPNFVFYGEGIPPRAYENSARLAARADVMLVVGTAGQVMPACSLPLSAKEHGCTIVEINPNPSAYTGRITDVYVAQAAGTFFADLAREMNL